MALAPITHKEEGSHIPAQPTYRRSSWAPRRQRRASLECAACGKSHNSARPFKHSLESSLGVVIGMHPWSFKNTIYEHLARAGWRASLRDLGARHLEEVEVAMAS